MKWFCVVFATLLLGCESPSDPRSAIADVEISPPAPSFGYFPLTNGAEIQLTAQVRYVDGSTASNVRVAWQSTVAALATVDSTGLVRITPTYAPCNDFGQTSLHTGPIGCGARVIATAAGRSDTTNILVIPRVTFDYPLPITITVGDSVALGASGVPVGRVDGVVRCSFFPAIVAPSDVIVRRGAYMIGLAEGEGLVGWMSGNTRVCPGIIVNTPVQVRPS